MSGDQRMERGLPMQVRIVDGEPANFDDVARTAACLPQTMAGQVVLWPACFVQEAWLAFTCGQTLVDVRKCDVTVLTPSDAVIIEAG